MARKYVTSDSKIMNKAEIKTVTISREPEKTVVTSDSGEKDK